MIWQHVASAECPLEEELKTDCCIFCGGRMRPLMDYARIGLPRVELRCCVDCGWWSLWKQTGRSPLDIGLGDQPPSALAGVIAELKRLDLVDVTTPLEEVTRFLLAKYDSRFTLHPRLFEETVASVFGALGYVAEATAYSRDGGIDVILQRANGSTIGVQVKRSRHPIRVEQIRSLAGALMHGGHTKGVFVTTSHFSREAQRASEVFRTRGYPMELIDAQRFLETLRLSQRSLYADYRDWLAAHGEPELKTVYDDDISSDGN